MRIAKIQQIRDLGIVVLAFAGGGDNHNPAVGIGLYDLPYSFVMRDVSHGGAAEFQDFQHK